MDVPGSHLHAEDEAVPVAGRVGLVSKAALVLSLDERSAVRVGRGYRSFRRARRAAGRRIVFRQVADRLFAQLFPFGIDFGAQPVAVHLRRLGDAFLLMLFLVRAGFDVRPVDEHRARVDHMLIERLVEDVREDLGSQLLRETLAESIAHRSEMAEMLYFRRQRQKPLSQTRGNYHKVGRQVLQIRKVGSS